MSLLDERNGGTSKTIASILFAIVKVPLKKAQNEFDVIW